MKQLYLLCLVLVFSSCKMYKSNIILKADENDINWKDKFQKAIVEHPIKIGDRIQFTVYTNLGESIIDPSGQLMKVSAETGNSETSQRMSYEVLEDGLCYFPVLGRLPVLGLKTSQLDSILSNKYELLYNEVVVISKVVNKKVVVIKGTGSNLVPYHTNINLLEVIALSGGLDNDSKGYNIRILRGDLNNPEVTVVNLKTITSMKGSIINLKPDDIIYIEPVRKVLSEGLRDNMFLMNLAQVALTFIVLINSL
ncbi:MAG: polysaccharide biosynthesis/export family protein [Bacteroidota bacterium]|nr:polysaccharide biosynthesis/export family protein [Bacteroidota bacterium]